MTSKELYFMQMHKKDRVILFFDKESVVGGITYVFTDNPEMLNERRNIWSIPKEDKNGKFVYIDRLTTNRKQSILSGLKELCRYFWTKYPEKQICWHSRRTGKLKEIGHAVYA